MSLTLRHLPRTTWSTLFDPQLGAPEREMMADSVAIHSPVLPKSDRETAQGREINPLDFPVVTGGFPPDESDRCATAPLPPFSHGKLESKKKKKRLPPQETINKIWSRFSAQKFSKAKVILPFDSQAAQNYETYKPSTTSQPGRNNLLVSDDYEREVQECRARVAKLVTECRMVNMYVYRSAIFSQDILDRAITNSHIT